jgi:hypothetical protein
VSPKIIISGHDPFDVDIFYVVAEKAIPFSSAAKRCWEGEGYTISMV